MIDNTDIQRIPLQISQGYVLASIQIDLTKEVLKQFRQDLLDLLSKTGAKGLIIDLSGVEVMDIEDFKALNNTLSMASLLGTTTILTGFQPGVVSSLVDFNVEFDHINATLNLDDAFELMKRLNSQEDSFSPEEIEDYLEEDLTTKIEENESLQVGFDWSK